MQKSAYLIKAQHCAILWTEILFLHKTIRNKLFKNILYIRSLPVITMNLQQSFQNHSKMGQSKQYTN